MTNSSKQSNLDFLITIPPKEFLSGIIPILNDIHDQGKGIHNYWATPLDQFMYETRRNLIKYVIRRETDNNEEFLALVKPDLKGNVYFAIANWLDWKDTCGLHKKYDSFLDFRNNTGLVLKYPIPVLAAAAILDDNLFVDVMYTIPDEVLEDIYAKVTQLVNLNYGDRLSQDAIDTGIERAKQRFAMLMETWEPD